MPLPLFTDATNTIQSLSDRPNQTDGLTPAQLKIKFDQHAINYEVYSNDILVPALDIELQNKTDDLNTHKTSTDHDGRYYTEAEINALLSAKTNLTGNHEGTWQGYSPTAVSTTIQAAVDANTAQIVLNTQQLLEQQFLNVREVRFNG